MKNKSYEKTLHLLLAGRHPKAKKFAGKHVLVISNEVIPSRLVQANSSNYVDVVISA